MGVEPTKATFAGGARFRTTPSLFFPLNYIRHHVNTSVIYYIDDLSLMSNIKSLNRRKHEKVKYRQGCFCRVNYLIYNSGISSSEQGRTYHSPCPA